MRDESQNALLKTLEEPPDFVHLILLSSEPEALLETIASRCQPVEFAPLPPAVLEAALAADRPTTPPTGRQIGRSADARRYAAGLGSSAEDSSAARLLLGERGLRELRAGGGALRATRSRSTAQSLDGALAAAARRRPRPSAKTPKRAPARRSRRSKEAGVKRTARDIADEAKRAGRRRRTEILDLGLELCAAWFRDLAAIVAGAEEVVFNRDRLDRLRAAAERGRARRRPPRPPSWSRTPAAASTSTSPRSSPWKRCSSASSGSSADADPVRIRSAEPEDAEDVAALLNAFNTEYEDYTPGVGKLTRHIKALLAGGEINVLLAGDTPDGFCQFRFKTSHYTGKPDALIEELYVVPDRRRQGIGRALLEATIEAARAAGATHVELNTGESDREARSLYESSGFTNLEGGPDGPRMLYYERDL